MTGFSPGASILSYLQHAAFNSRKTELELRTFKQQKAFGYLIALVRSVVPRGFSQVHPNILFTFPHRLQQDYEAECQQIEDPDYVVAWYCGVWCVVCGVW